MRSTQLLSTVLLLASSLGLMQHVVIHATVAPATQNTGVKPVSFADLAAVVKNTGDEGDYHGHFPTALGLTTWDKPWPAHQRTDRLSGRDEGVQTTMHQFDVGKDADGAEVAVLMKKYNITSPPVMLDAFVCNLQGKLLVTADGSPRAFRAGGGGVHAIPKR